MDEYETAPSNVRSRAGLYGDFLALALPFWKSDEKWSARGILALVLTLNFSLIYVSVLLNKWNNSFFDAIERHDFSAFEFQLLHFVVLAMAYVVVAVHQTYFLQSLEIKWRRWLTRYLIHLWLADQAYYHLLLRHTQADNPDQRISEDLKLFVGLTLSLSMGFLSSAVTVVSFMAILWHLSGVINIPVGDQVIPLHGYMVWAALLYSIIGTLITHWVGDPLVKLNFVQQSVEANFRFSMVRLRENSDGIAFYRGEPSAERAFASRFQQVIDNWRKIMLRQKRIAWFTLSYGQSATVLPLLLAAPRYLSGLMTLGDLTQSVAAFTQIQSSLSWLINIYGSYAEWRATLDRLRGFIGAVREGGRADNPGGISLQATSHNELAIEDLHLNHPDGRSMLKCGSFRVESGESVVLMGPSGSGKSTLLRSIAGLWPFGHGRIAKPANDVLFIPQRAYLPVAPLREILTYPVAPDRFTDEAPREMLEVCGLPHLAPLLDETDNWTLALSMGEQQRIAFARAILLRPKWLFFDEATSAMDEITEANMYRLIKTRLPKTTLFSVSHRPALAAFHDRLMETVRHGQEWSLVHKKTLHAAQG